ncbi:hypothetical protein [Kitasatospora sp. NPDC059160]|uniref:hypothetical protein n=1 Tax=Kitasatospora sp. NPDC059160 TaxID=3346748 RepID=UPI0036D0136D
MDSTTRRPAVELVPPFDTPLDTAAASTTAVPGVYEVKDPGGGLRYVYADSVETAVALAAVEQAAEQTRATLAAPAATASAVVERPRLVEPWMVKGTVGLGLTGGALALAPLAEAAVGSLASALGELLKLGLEVGGAAFALVLLAKVLGSGTKKSSPTVEVVQTITQTITQTIRIEK